ncbi:DUF4191 domain-containing protein [Brachybacterium sp. AOP25-B2-12]|uniref:DUF4191 domain-containing protein n=1 Tax=Brachybacterium sp. AOP25-B2-12 TaxID=3457710 RepID=UPI0040346AA5
MPRQRKTSEDAPKPPKKPGRIKQMYQVYQQTQEIDRRTLPYMLLGLIVPVIVAVPLTWWLMGTPWYGVFIGIMLGVLAALFILARKAEAAAYGRIRGQQGAALAALQSIRRGWNVEEHPAAIDRRTQSMVFRASGRAGIALVVESSSGPTLAMLRKEKRILDRIVPNVPVHEIVVGEGEGEVPIHKLATYMTRMRPKLTKQEAGVVAKRLRALPNPVSQAIPKGVDPMRARPNRKALRGG